MRSNTHQKLKRPIQVRAPALRFEKKDLANDTQHMPPALSWRNEFLDFVRKQDQTHFVVISDRRKSQDRGNLGGELAFRLRAGAEQARTTDIDNQHECQFPLFDEFLDERMIHSRRHVPIDRAHFVARLVLTDLLEVHALALEDAVILPGEGFAHKPIGAELDLADLLKNFARYHDCPVPSAKSRPKR